jgi:hypothetical protein
MAGTVFAFAQVCGKRLHTHTHTHTHIYIYIYERGEGGKVHMEEAIHIGHVLYQYCSHVLYSNSVMNERGIYHIEKPEKTGKTSKAKAKQSR